MKSIYQLAITIVLVFSFASCASEKTVTSSKVRSGLDQYNNGYDMEKGEHGMSQSGSDKVSQYDKRGPSMGARDFSGKDYNKESYRKKRWGGNQGYASKQYGGKTDGSKFKHSPHYVSRDVRAQANGQYATANKSQFNNTGEFHGSGNRANEGGTSPVKTSNSGYVTSRNNVSEPLIMSREDYNKLSVRETNMMLGR